MTDNHFFWASLFKHLMANLDHSACDSHRVSIKLLQAAALGGWCVSWQAHCNALLSAGGSLTHPSPAQLRRLATKCYYHIPAQWRLFGQALCQLHCSVHGWQAARAPEGSFFPLWAYKIKNYVRVEQLSWHAYSKLQPTSISSEKHSCHCGALQPCCSTS